MKKNFVPSLKLWCRPCVLILFAVYLDILLRTRLIHSGFLLI